MVFSIRGKDYKMQIQIPENAEKIIDILMSHGYEAYVVGWLCQGYSFRTGTKRLGYYNFRFSNRNKRTVSKNCRYRDSAWNCHCFNGKRGL